jgi:LysM repeat protein
MDAPPKGRAENTEVGKGGKGSKHHSSKQNEAIVSTLSRQMYLRNEIRYVLVQEGDTYQSLERTLQVRKWQLVKYNDKQNPDLVPGEMLYLQPKRNRNPQYDHHVVASGETMRWISQEYGIKLKQLYKYNNLAAGEEPAPGTKVWLRKRKHSEY